MEIQGVDIKEPKMLTSKRLRGSEIMVHHGVEGSEHGRAGGLKWSWYHFRPSVFGAQGVLISDPLVVEGIFKTCPLGCTTLSHRSGKSNPKPQEKTHFQFDTLELLIGYKANWTGGRYATARASHVRIVQFRRWNLVEIPPSAFPPANTSVFQCPHLWAKLLLQEALTWYGLSCPDWLRLPPGDGSGTDDSCGHRTSEVDPYSRTNGKSKTDSQDLYQASSQR